MFSVIIPLYNKASYVKKAIDSVFRQVFSEFELIVINDGSIDNSLSVVQEIEDDRLIVISQINQGVSASRNNGVKAARFDYIAFLDADDWWDDQFLLEMSKLIRLFPDAGIYGSKYFWVKNGRYQESVNHMPTSFVGYIDYIITYRYAWWMPLHCISSIIPKQVFEKIGGFKTNLKFGEDFELWIRISLKYKIAYLNKPLAYYNQDVAADNRALGGKIWKKEEHFLFNLGFLTDEELIDPILKELLDGLRVRSLLPYHLRNAIEDDVNTILKSVNFKTQPYYFTFLYKWPKWTVKVYFLLMRLGSQAKQFFKK